MLLKNWFLKRSIKKRGVIVPVMISEDGRVLDGNHRIKIAQELDIKLPIVVIPCEYMEVNANDLKAREVDW